jgi:hypothetical protein
VGDARSFRTAAFLGRISFGAKEEVDPGGALVQIMLHAKRGTIVRVPAARRQGSHA